MDKIRLERVIDNLLDNAVKYSPPNTRIDVATLDLGDYIQISVSDEGKGISQEDQARLFSPFERLSEGATSKPGLGLGLLVCRRLVEARGQDMGGVCTCNGSTILRCRQPERSG